MGEWSARNSQTYLCRNLADALGHTGHTHTHIRLCIVCGPSCCMAASCRGHLLNSNFIVDRYNEMRQPLIALWVRPNCSHLHRPNTFDVIFLKIHLIAIFAVNRSVDQYSLCDKISIDSNVYGTWQLGAPYCENMLAVHCTSTMDDTHSQIRISFSNDYFICCARMCIECAFGMVSSTMCTM